MAYIDVTVGGRFADDVNRLSIKVSGIENSETSFVNRNVFIVNTGDVKTTCAVLVNYTHIVATVGMKQHVARTAVYFKTIEFTVM